MRKHNSSDINNKTSKDQNEAHEASKIPTTEKKPKDNDLTKSVNENP